MNPTHDWHVGTDGMELMIRRDESDSVGVMLGHENIDDQRSTTIITSRLLEMIDTVQPDAIAAYRAEHEALLARIAGAAALRTWAAAVEEQLAATYAAGIELGEWGLGLRSGLQQAFQSADKIDQETTR